VLIWPFSVAHSAVTDSDSTLLGSLLVTDILFVLFLHRIESVEVEDDRSRFFIVGSRAEKGITVRFNVVRWQGILAGDMRYASSDVSSLHHTAHPRREPRFPLDHSTVTEPNMNHKIHSDFCVLSPRVLLLLPGRSRSYVFQVCVLSFSYGSGCPFEFCRTGTFSPRTAKTKSG